MTLFSRLRMRTHQPTSFYVNINDLIQSFRVVLSISVCSHSFEDTYITYQQQKNALKKYLHR